MNRKILMLFVSIALAICPFLSAHADSPSGSLKLTVTGANNNKGVVRVALYNSKDSYAADKHNTGDGAFKKGTAEIKNSKAEYSFSDLPFGQYAVKVYHDEDNSGTFYTGAFGIPKVQYGFSNNAKGMMGPAPFNKAIFDLKSPQMSMAIELSK
jgi:uncharacterized protein (DUF2141 family)